MLNLQRMSLFIAVVDSGSFTAAAAASGQTKAVVSFNIRQLEKELGVTLLLRSTRRLTLTDAGVLFYQKGVNLLNAAKNLQDEVRASHSGLGGELRITTTPEFGEQVVIPVLAQFSQRHPDLRIRHMSSSHHADLIAERFDVAIRLGSLADSRYRAALISRFTILPVAAPQWLARHPVSSLESLAQAEWIIHKRLPTPLRWTVTNNHGQHSRLEISKAGKISVDSAHSSRRFPSHLIKLQAIRSAAPETSSKRPIITPRPITRPMLPSVVPNPLVMTESVLSMPIPPNRPAMQAAASIAISA